MAAEGPAGAAAAAPATGDPWRWAPLAIAWVMAMPVLAVAWQAVAPALGDGDAAQVWSHLVATVLPGYARTTLLLLLGVGAAAALLGVTTAWLVTMTRFPGRRLLTYALLLPLALPAYVVAYIYTDILDYGGPVQGALRAAFGWTSRRDYWFPSIHSLGGAVAVMTLTLYPYVYLLARAAFLAQSRRAIEAARTLGLTPAAALRRVTLPLARPAIVVGVSLVMMEALADFGTVEHFAVATLTLGVYDAWMNMGSATAAAQLSLVMLALALALLATERLARRGRRFHQRPQPAAGRAGGDRLTGWRAAAAVGFCAAPVLLGFVLPVAVLADLSLAAAANGATGVSRRAIATSLVLALAASAVACGLGLVLAYALRLRPGRASRVVTRIAASGYAVPGAVLAVGVLIPLAAIDNAVDGWARATLGLSTGLVLSGSFAALVYGYTVRFLALSLGAAESGLARITPAMDGVARTLGCSPSAVLWRVHLPMLQASLLTAGLLVFVDTIKELPITLLLRPFNVETLATGVYQYAAHDRFADGAAGALLIVLVGLGPVIVLARALQQTVAPRPGAGG